MGSVRRLGLEGHGVSRRTVVTLTFTPFCDEKSVLRQFIRKTTLNKDRVAN